MKLEWHKLMKVCKVCSHPLKKLGLYKVIYVEKKDGYKKKEVQKYICPMCQIESWE